MARMVAASFVHSWADYTGYLIHGSNNISKLQREQNSLSHVVLPSVSSLPSTVIFTDPCWLSVHFWIKFKLACLTYKVLTADQPTYLHLLLHQYAASCCLCSTDKLLTEEHFLTKFCSVKYLLMFHCNYLEQIVSLH